MRRILTGGLPANDDEVNLNSESGDAFIVRELSLDWAVEERALISHSTISYA